MSSIHLWLSLKLDENYHISNNFLFLSALIFKDQVVGGLSRSGSNNYIGLLIYVA